MTDALHPSSRLSRSTVGTMAPDAGESRLSTVLRANAASSLVSGVILAAAPGVVDNVLDTGQPGWIRLVGFALVPFALACLWLSTQRRGILEKVTPLVVLGDLAWVMASVVTVLLGWYSTAGIVAVAAMALVVDVFAVLQFRAWRALQRAKRPS